MRDRGSWAEISSWRRERRAALMAARNALSADEHRAIARAIDASLATGFPDLASRFVGFYWPIRREFDPLPLVRRLIAAGGRAALPVVMGKGMPLEFRAWHPGAKMAVGVYDIPYPADGPAVLPEALLVPLLGFDCACFRLGYGAGYYDRTLASFPVRPLAIGIGFEIGRLETIHPQPHDIPMDAVVSEAGIFRCARAAGSAP